MPYNLCSTPVQGNRQCAQVKAIVTLRASLASATLVRQALIARMSPAQTAVVTMVRAIRPRDSANVMMVGTMMIRQIQPPPARREIVGTRKCAMASVSAQMRIAAMVVARAQLGESAVAIPVATSVSQVAIRAHKTRLIAVIRPVAKGTPLQACVAQMTALARSGHYATALSLTLQPLADRSSLFKACLQPDMPVNTQTPSMPHFM